MVGQKDMADLWQLVKIIVEYVRSDWHFKLVRGLACTIENAGTQEKHMLEFIHLGKFVLVRFSDVEVWGIDLVMNWGGMVLLHSKRAHAEKDRR
eukprot:4807436-Amphidinium_carterae.1